MKRAAKIYTALIFVFLFAPIVILLVFSFNEAKSLSVFSGFSLKWYQELFRDGETLNALKNTLILAVVASLVSTAMGTAAAVGMNRMRNKYLRAALDTATDIPMMNPDIITGISLMLMFVFFGRLLGASTSLGFWSMLAAHITFCLPYVIMQVLPKLQQMDRSLPEAAMDLGCTPVRAFFRVEVPEILPGIITGMIMAFTLSLDDFVISYFTQGSGFQTLPIRIYNMTKKTVTPKMYALATIIFFVILALLILTNLVDSDPNAGIRDARRAKRAGKPARAKRSGSGRRPVRAAVGILTAAALLIAGISIYSSRQETRVLNVYNWGEYISDGSDDSLDTIAAFEDWYKATYGVPVKVNYDTYASNEDMYAKLKSGAVSYDVVIPSDYMIARMEAEDMLLPLNYDNIPNYQYISEDFRGLYYDPDDTYTVPYTYGIVGVIYNANVVDEADTGSWDLMWNPKYAGNILQFARDALGTAMYRAGIDVNTTDHADWQQALQALVDQRPLVKSYVMDEIYNMMESGEAAIGAYYAGDYFTMLDAEADDVDLRFYYPERTNYFIDAMCIPSCCQNKEAAETFINFLCKPEIAGANMDWLGYGTPDRLVYDDPEYIDDMGEDTMAILYPDIGSFRDAYNRSAYRNLDQDTLTYVNSLWETLKIN